MIKNKQKRIEHWQVNNIEQLLRKIQLQLYKKVYNYVDLNITIDNLMSYKIL